MPDNRFPGLPPELALLLSRITSLHSQQPRYMETVRISVEPHATDHDQALSLIGLFDVETAHGAQLDAVGQWVGLTRYVAIDAGVWLTWNNRHLGWDTGKWWNPYETADQLVRLDDPHYRLLLLARIAANYWNGTIPGAYAVWDQYLAGTGYEFIIQDQFTRAIPFFAFDDPGGGFDRSMWKHDVLQDIYLTFDEPKLGWDTGYWYGPHWALYRPVERAHGNMNVLYAMLGPPLDPVNYALFTGGYLGLQSAAVGTAYAIQSQPDPDDPSAVDGTGLPLFAFDAGPEMAPGIPGYWVTFDVEGLGFDQAPLFYPGALPIMPPDWPTVTRPDYLYFDGPAERGWDSGAWFEFGWRPPPPVPPPSTGVIYPPFTLAGWDFGGWAQIVVPTHTAPVLVAAP